MAKTNGKCEKQENHWDTKKYEENILKRNLFWWCFASKGGAKY